MHIQPWGTESYSTSLESSDLWFFGTRLPKRERGRRSSVPHALLSTKLRWPLSLNIIAISKWILPLESGEKLVPKSECRKLFQLGVNYHSQRHGSTLRVCHVLLKRANLLHTEGQVKTEVPISVSCWFFLLNVTSINKQICNFFSLRAEVSEVAWSMFLQTCRDYLFYFLSMCIIKNIPLDQLNLAKSIWKKKLKYETQRP